MTILDFTVRLVGTAQTHNSELWMLYGVSTTDAAVDQIERRGFAFLDASAKLQKLMEEVFEAGDRFFESDMVSKLDDRLPLDTGYRPYGNEYSQSSDHPDEVESFTASYRVPNPESQLSMLGNELHAKMLTIFDTFECAAEEITSSLASRFHRAPLDLSGAFQNWSLLQFNYSRPSLTSDDFINDLHEDGCLLTIMSIAEAGLELRSGTGFTPIPASKRHVLVMAGEILWLLTGGAVDPIFHRVRTISSHPRRKSLLFFADINPAICDPWILSDVNRGIDIGQKVLQNSARFGLSEWKSEE
jgi:isopenicillin N synthase-like dioxygenase